MPDRVRAFRVKARISAKQKEWFDMQHERRHLRASPVVRQRARELRREQTHAETVLWERLRGQQVNGLKFRRQHPIGRFVVDFYCPEAGLVVEVDGPVHQERADVDAMRTEMLEQAGLRVVRFSNTQVLEDLENVVSRILALTRPGREKLLAVLSKAPDVEPEEADRL